MPQRGPGDQDLVRVETAAGRLVSLHRDFDYFRPHGEGARATPARPEALEGRTMAARAALPGPSSFETAGKSRPPPDEELLLNYVKILVSRRFTSQTKIPEIGGFHTARHVRCPSPSGQE
jgi:hypothetical protein